jgi:hypothetical protein
MASPAFHTLDLPGGSVVPFDSVPGERVRVLCGHVWLTEEGSAHDAFLGSGEEVRLATNGLAVIEALGPARVQLSADGGSSATVLARAVRRFLARLATSAPRPVGAV